MPKRSARSLWTAKLSGQPLPKPSAMPVARGLGSLAGAGGPFCGLVLGIDPSLRGTGLALLRADSRAGTFALLASQTVKTGRATPMPLALAEIAEAVEALCEAHGPVGVALEQTIYVQNHQAAQTMGAVRGACIVTAARRGLPVHEYPPLRIKQAVTGNGRASKEQVAGLVRQHLGMGEKLAFDEADAAAAALCHALTFRL